MRTWIEPSRVRLDLGNADRNRRFALSALQDAAEERGRHLQDITSEKLPIRRVAVTQVDHGAIVLAQFDWSQGADSPLGTSLMTDPRNRDARGTLDFDATKNAWPSPEL